jgi:hypothetical protein
MEETRKDYEAAVELFDELIEKYNQASLVDEAFAIKYIMPEGNHWLHRFKENCKDEHGSFSRDTISMALNDLCKFESDLIKLEDYYADFRERVRISGERMRARRAEQS